MHDRTHRVVRDQRYWSAADWAALVGRGIRQSYEAGQYLLHQGAEGSWVAALVSGRAKVVYATEQGQEVLLAMRGPGDLVGEFSHGDREPRSASVLAIERCVASLIADTLFTDWLGQRDVRAGLERYALAKTRDTAEMMWHVAHGRPAQRLANLLLATIAAGGESHPAPHVVPMRHEELARAVGLTRSSVAPVMAEWKRLGVVTVERSQTTVLDPAALDAIRRGALKV